VPPPVASGGSIIQKLPGYQLNTMSCSLH